jgi:hypothetical protein
MVCLLRGKRPWGIGRLCGVAGRPCERSEAICVAGLSEQGCSAKVRADCFETQIASLRSQGRASLRSQGRASLRPQGREKERGCPQDNLFISVNHLRIWF